MNTEEAIKDTQDIQTTGEDATDLAEKDLAEIDVAVEVLAADTNDEASTPEPPPMRILCIKDCGSLSGRSTLTYHIGCSEDSTIPHLRIFANSAKGYFCKEWISLTLLDQLLSETKSFASSTLQQMFFEGKSANSGGFVLAALCNEGLARAIPGSLRSYEQLDPRAWKQAILALIEAGVSLSENDSAKGVLAASPEPSMAAAMSSGKSPAKLSAKARGTKKKAAA